ncbi:MAG: hypothetical protein COA97_07425 [Flavobacteriales bacterium]|nr:MAG: hypothetical protein COA97_07425 [Flavobacteriales bacterium]
MRGLTRNILGTFSTQIPSLIISIVSGIFLTRLLGPAGKGIYGIFYLNIEIMVMVFTLGCEMGIIYYGSNKKISMGKLQGIAIIIPSIILPIISIIILSFNLDFLFPDNYDSLFYKLFLIGVFSLRLINGLFITFLNANKSFRFINRITLIISVFNLAAYFFLFYLNSNGIITVDVRIILGVNLLLLLINTLMWGYSFRKSIQFQPIFNLSLKQDIYPFFLYIYPVWISMIINFLNYRFDSWFIFEFRGEKQLGLYLLAVNFAQFILFYSRIIGSVMMPYLSEDNNEQRRKYFTTYSRINFTSVVLIVIVLAFIGDWLLVTLYGEEFTNSGGPFKVLLVGMVFTAMSQLFSIMLFSKGKNNIALIANSVGLVATILLDVLLIPKYGIMGAAVATSISYFLLFIVLLYYLIIREKIKFSDLFIIKKTDFKAIFQKD